VGKVPGKFQGDLFSLLRMINQGAVPEIVLREGLPGTDFPKEGRIKGLRERLLFDIVRGEMAEDARLHISTGIDMKVFPPPCNASLSETSIIPEVDKEHRFGGPKIGEPFPHPVPLLRSCHEGKIGLSTDGDVVEVPEEDTSLFNQKINEFIAGEDISVLRGLGGRDREEDSCPFQPVHHLCDVIELALSPSPVCLFPEPFEADRGNDISKLNKPFHHPLVNQGAISINLENGIRVLLEEVKEVFSQEGFSTCYQHQMDAHLLALPYHTIDHFERKVLLGIAPRVATIAVEIASHGRAEDHGVRRVESPFRLKGLSPVGAHQELVDDEV